MQTNATRCQKESRPCEARPQDSSIYRCRIAPMVTFATDRYRLQNREFPENTPKILFGDFLRIPSKILKKYSQDSNNSQKILQKYSPEYFWSIFRVFLYWNYTKRGRRPKAAAPFWYNLGIKCSKNAPKMLREYFWSIFWVFFESREHFLSIF